MAVPVQIQTATRPLLEQALARLAARPGFRQRPEQNELATAIYDAMLAGAPICAEAPTGTGKSLAYLIGAVAAAQELQRRAPQATPLPVVVSTNTATLQSQIVDKDIQVVADIGLINPDHVALAKGRGRYFCPLMAQKTAKIPLRPTVRQSDLFGMAEDDMDPSLPGDRREALHLFNVWKSGAWSGVSDDWNGKLPPIWREVRASTETCIGSRCWAYATVCPFFEARRQLGLAQVIVANHDLVLADLDLRQGDEPGIFPFDDYMLVLDEAHNLPAKAIEQAKRRGLLLEPRYWLNTLPGFAEACSQIDMLHSFFESDAWYHQLSSRAMSRQLGDLFRQLEQRFGRLEVEYVRLPNLWPEFVEALQDTARKGWGMLAQLRAVRTALENLTRGNIDGAAALLAECTRLMGRMENLLTAYKAFANGELPVRWIEFRRDKLGTVVDFALCTAPLEGAEVLKQILWPRLNRVALVSATLMVLGDFAYFRRKAGLPPRTRYAALPHIFPYAESQLELGGFESAPPGGPAFSPEAYETELAQWLTQNVDPRAATLVLFTSYRTMNAVIGRLPPAMQERILKQERGVSKHAIDLHRSRIDAGEGSILMGTESFAEGLDLAGEYCTHLVITRLPFERPDNPVAEARKELAGDAHFVSNILPEATRKLVQSVGRLIRRETDRGRVSLLDNRVWRTQYGNQMLESLPPFSRVHR